MCIRLTEEEFERIEGSKLSPRELILKACSMLEEKQTDIIEESGSESVDNSVINDNKGEDPEEEFTYEDGRESGKYDALSGGKREDWEIDDDYTKGYDKGYDEGLEEVARKSGEREAAQKRLEEQGRIREQTETAQREEQTRIWEEQQRKIAEEEQKKRAKRDIFKETLKESHGDRFLGVALREKGITFSDLEHEEKKIIFQKMNDNADILRRVQDKLEEFAKGIGTSFDEVKASYDEIRPSLNNNPIWG